MFQYILKRILYFIPTLFAISLITFFLSKVAPGDPVELRLQGGMQSQAGGQLTEKLAGEKAYLDLSERMGLNLPAFYFEITSKASPDTLYKIPRKKERENLSRLVNEYGNWQQISDYYHSVKQLEFSLFDMQTDTSNFARVRQIRETCNELYTKYDDITIQRLIGVIEEAVNVNSLASAQPYAKAVKEKYALMQSQATPGKKYIPAFHFYGTHNQYHRWLFGDVPWIGENDDPRKQARGFFRADFGVSYLDGRPVSSILWDAVGYTMLINIIAIIIAYLVSIPIGVETAIRKDTVFDRFTTTTLFILYSLPSFWIATMLIIFFTNSEYGMNWFPTHGVHSQHLSSDASFFERIGDLAYHLVLPVFCIVYGSFAFISRQMRGGMLTVIRQDYIRTARAKGLDNKTVTWKHAFRNSLIPIITMFAGLFPAMISGALIIEIIFSIPGMGKVSYESVVARNYPVLYTVLMFSAILTMLGILVSDLLYALVDPRISFTKKTR